MLPQPLYVGIISQQRHNLLCGAVECRACYLSALLPCACSLSSAATFCGAPPALCQEKE